MPKVNKRDYVAALYVGAAWKKQVAAMPEAQIVAIYLKERQKKEVEFKNRKNTTHTTTPDSLF